ncbi:MAG TPA: tRNA uridine-5-carboxymethylaminomethyl(34) synthesis GTPase MnmE [Chthoniobacterales bacterium]
MSAASMPGDGAAELAIDTIAAVATPPGEGAIAMVRVSGPEARRILGEVFQPRHGAGPETPRRTCLGAVADGAGVIDHGMAVWYRGPASYTGEDVVELTCHGGMLVVQRVLEALLRHGARLAEPGEFTQRAFLNGKIDLTQAEAVMDLIRAQTDLALRAANQQLSGNLGAELLELQDALLTVLAHIEAYIDFPDEAIDPDTTAELASQLEGVIQRVNPLLASAEQGRVLRHGLRTVIYGPPNVGKSSLLNLLLGFERAIVSAVPGTTRDTIEEVINVRGVPVRLVDTAGARPTGDEVEQAGIARTARELINSDLVLWVVDGSQPKPAMPPPGQPHVLILNKSDLGLHRDWEAASGAIPFSCWDKTGVEPLKQSIFARFLQGGAGTDTFRIAISVRHEGCLTRAKGALDEALVSLREERSPEFTAIEIREALEAIGEVVGKTDTEDLLGRIFSEFCIGK